MEDKIEHIVEIDEYTEVKLKIPERLTPIELKALMHKTNKLFNLAEVPIKKPKVGRPNGNSDSSGTFYLTNAQLYKWVKAHVSTKNIAKRVGASQADIKKRIQYLRDKGKWNDKLLGGK